MGLQAGFPFEVATCRWNTQEEARGEKTSRYEHKKKKHAHGSKRHETEKMIGYEMCYLSTHYVFGQVGYIRTYHLLKYHEAGIIFKMEKNDDKMDKISKISWNIWNQK